MLNKPLFDALVKAVGSVSIVNEGDPGNFSLDQMPSGFAKGKKKDITLSVHSWGESYRFNCPVCGDNRSRAFVCHRIGTVIPVPGTTKHARFSKYLTKCHNEECQKTPEFRKFIDSLELPADYETAAIAEVGRQEVPKEKKLLVSDVDLPNPSYAIHSMDVPDEVRMYLLNRGFDLDELHNHYRIRYSPQNATYTVGNTEHRLHNDRIIIPIVQHLHMISWQGRAVSDDIQPKYFNLPKGNKKTWLYNFDKALLYPEVIIYEGVTNVWRTGSDSIALFGKCMSAEQLSLMQTVWSFDGSAVVCLDEDTYHSDADLRCAKMLIMNEAFAKGVAVLRLRGGDAAQHSHKRIRQLKRLAHELVSTDYRNIRILDENDVKENPMDDEQEPRVTDKPLEDITVLAEDLDDSFELIEF